MGKLHTHTPPKQQVLHQYCPCSGPAAFNCQAWLPHHPTPLVPAADSYLETQHLVCNLGMPLTCSIAAALPAHMRNACRFYDAQNRRDLMSVTQLLAGDVTYENLAVADILQGRTVSTGAGRRCRRGCQWLAGRQRFWAPCPPPH
jgi:hypothetical protein